MIRKFYIAMILALMLSFSFEARADKDFIQKIQTAVEKGQEKAKSFQEQVQKIKDQAKGAAEGVAGAAAEVQSGIADVTSGDFDKMKSLGKRVEGLPEGKDVAPDEMSEAVADKYVPKAGQDNEDENFKQQQEQMQEIMRNAVSKLYAIGFTTRTNMLEEKPQDVDMEDTSKMLQNTRDKAIELIQRLAQIYILEAAVEEYQYTQSLRTVKNDVSEDSEEGE